MNNKTERFYVSACTSIMLYDAKLGLSFFSCGVGVGVGVAPVIYLRFYLTFSLKHVAVLIGTGILLNTTATGSFPLEFPGKTRSRLRWVTH